jgi:hypothetical protein
MNGRPIDWGIPDWTNPDGYPGPRSHITVFAWEFLRRWSEYRAFWLEKIQPLIDGNGRMRIGAPEFWPWHAELKYRFGVEVPSAPWDRSPAYFAGNYVRWEEGQKIFLKEHEIAILIDLKRPLERQFLMAQEAAEEEQKRRQIKVKKSRSAAVNYRAYLRVLDADEAGAKTGQIADLLLSHSPGKAGNNLSRLVGDYRTAARKLRDGGYRALLEAR